MLTQSAAVFNPLSSQFISLLAGVIRDMGYDIPLDPNHHFPFYPFIFLASSLLMTHPNIHMLISIYLKWYQE